MSSQLLKRVNTTSDTETYRIKTNMHRNTFIAMFVLFCAYVIKENFTDNQSSNKPKLSAKKYKKEQVSKAAFDRFNNKLLTKTWPKLVMYILLGLVYI